ncbi:hypothetical protein B0T26DRAFT_656223 [Lasiosphaeria miniovina]|uniref:Uncharacterized protein n=1 Tax=Lasiosphaeria miniovina TaxID=1954250 RepID=A0AA40DNL0_9PEZI|nr:uncharacterized protein B0T26DRAFT_656223 [Lasiosphaeria miniovina]KAK0706443.1 hypothetical protein B0T26DRAFT_656223 [Lasiosphaeria miniovina]
MSSPMDIAPSPFSSRAADASCAFPSWPRRSSLSEYDAAEERASSYIPDEDFFPEDVFEDDARSVSSNGSSSPVQSPPAQAMTEADLLEMQRERAAYQREVMRFLVTEKERRRQAAKRTRRSSSSGATTSSSSSSKKSPKSKLCAMTPIAEAE